MGNRNKILVVEDNRETQLIIKAVLRNDFDLEIVPSADAARNALSRDKIDLVLLDLNLSGEGNGKSILMEIRGGSKTKDLPVIVTTAYDLNEEDKKFFEENANTFLLKPLDKKILLESINALLSRN
jgi:DNA-binding response OmpR family regulator